MSPESNLLKKYTYSFSSYFSIQYIYILKSVPVGWELPYRINGFNEGTMVSDSSNPLWNIIPRIQLRQIFLKNPILNLFVILDTIGNWKGINYLSLFLWVCLKSHAYVYIHIHNHTYIHISPWTCILRT